MDVVLLKLVEQLNASVFTLTLILVVVFWLLFRSGKWAQMWEDHNKRVEKIEGLSEKVVSLMTKVDLIYQNTNPRALIAAHSPISLTDLGKKVSKEISAEKIFNNHKNTLLKLLEEKKPSDAYDIQVDSIVVTQNDLLKLLSEEELSVLKDSAYMNGLVLDDILKIFAILLRNEALKLKNISLLEVDKYAPQDSIT